MSDQTPPLDSHIPGEKSGQPPHEGDTPTQQKANTDRKAPDGKMQSDDRPNDDQPPPGGQGRESKKHRSPEEWIAQASIASAVVGFFVLIAQLLVLVEMNSQRRLMVGQLRAMRTQTGEMQSAGKQTDQLIAATQKIGVETNRLATAAVSSATTAADTLRLSQAGITALPDTIVNIDQMQSPPGVNFSARGVFPALHVSIWASWDIVKTDDLANFEYPVPSTRRTLGITLAPGDVTRAEGKVIPTGMTDEQRNLLKSGKYVLFDWGTADFEDGISHKHFSHACQMMFYTPAGMLAGRAYCPGWNDSE